MKCLIFLFLSFNVFAEGPSQAPLVITLNDVVSKVSQENYSVYANALRVYQARESVKVARMNLLPRLNIWRIASAATGGVSGLLGVVEDIAPFLVPANWFRVREQRLLYVADMEGYRALWANELMSAKMLYVHLLLDKSLLSLIEQSRQELLSIDEIVKMRELLGGAPHGASRDVEIRMLGLQEDKRSLEVLIEEEESLLAYMMALPTTTRVTPADIEMPSFESFSPLDYADFEFRALDSAPELRQYDAFIAAADYVRRATMYSFLGTTSMSRGVAGGVFDSLPTQDGLGFGTPASMRVVSAEKELLRVQRRGAEETIKRQLRLLVSNYNLDLENYNNLKRRENLTAEALESLFERTRLGEQVETLALIEASRNHIQADTAFFSVKFRFLTNEDKLARLIFHGDYAKQPVIIESLNSRREANP